MKLLAAFLACALPLVHAEWDQDPRCPGYGMPRSFFDGNLTEYEVLEDELTNAKLLNGGNTRGLRGDVPRRLDEEDENYFQLKLYWERGYCWQAEWNERRWCLECEGGSCGNGDLLFIQECDGSSAQRFVYEEIAGSGGGRIKPYTRQDLCWERTSSRSHTLEPCETMSCRQIIKGISRTTKFEMHPNGKPFDCLENHHHPKANEVIYASDCWTARSHKTSFWEMYNARNEANDVEEEKPPLPPGSRTINNLGRDVCDDDNQCGLCQGDCDNDDDCLPGLECFRRDDDEPVPGCSGGTEDDDGLDICIDPTGTYTIPPTFAPTTAAPTAAIAAVQLTGDCEFQFPSSAPSDPPTIAPTVSFKPSSVPTGMPSVSPSALPSMVPTEAARCEISPQGTYGEEGSTADFVDYYYELETDPVLNASLLEILGELERQVLLDVLPELFGENCTGLAETIQRSHRMLSFSPVGASIEPLDEIVQGASCRVKVNETNDCVVVAGSMSVFSFRDQEYDEFLLPSLQNATNDGLFNNVHPAIVRVGFPEDQSTAAIMATSSKKNGGGFENPGLFAILAVGVVGLIAGAFVWRRIRNRAGDKEIKEGALPSTAPPSPQQTEGTPSDGSMEDDVEHGIQYVSKNVPPSPQREEAGIDDSIVDDDDDEFHDSVATVEEMGSLADSESDAESVSRDLSKSLLDAAALPPVQVETSLLDSVPKEKEAPEEEEFHDIDDFLVDTSDMPSEDGQEKELSLLGVSRISQEESGEAAPEDNKDTAEKETLEEISSPSGSNDAKPSNGSAEEASPESNDTPSSAEDSAEVADATKEDDSPPSPEQKAPEATDAPKQDSSQEPEAAEVVDATKEEARPPSTEPEASEVDDAPEPDAPSPEREVKAVECPPSPQQSDAPSTSRNEELEQGFLEESDDYMVDTSDTSFIPGQDASMLNTSFPEAGHDASLLNITQDPDDTQDQEECAPPSPLRPDTSALPNESIDANPKIDDSCEQEAAAVPASLLGSPDTSVNTSQDGPSWKAYAFMGTEA